METIVQNHGLFQNKHYYNDATAAFHFHEGNAIANMNEV